MADINITTKGGDNGTTSLGNGVRVDKDDQRVELYGTLDECQAALGMARAACLSPKTAEDIFFLEDYLFNAMAFFAECDFPEPDPQILANVSSKVARTIKKAELFVRPGDSSCGAALHLARTIARRAERTATPLFREKRITDKSYAFLNRLSDVIYIISLKVDEEEREKKN
ncbi:MAG: cob(I)yrinic acid a,c-diamide adenosyltransferase [Synergistaceae bacterium]|nr:cob(I)yrinic acid a,c-diamide adenosyltransferase [Synergistaceae bacterium]